MKRSGNGRGQDAAMRYRAGFERGYEQGLARGSETFGQPFHGTSIVIPSYNQADYLARCIESIEHHTAEPYEIIVVDNGSTDGTEDYLEKRIGQLRYRRLETNRGFAGGVNHGLMMAKGDTIVILNNDTLVTNGWLTHMLRCLHSDSRIGAVGPVTNYISGEQQIEVPYETVEQMWNYADAYSRPDPSKWKQTDRLVGFCLLFRRELLERVGYFDEGFRIGNYEDDDWIIRIRLCGLKLIIAGDAFIHHFGSVSMKSLRNEEFQTVEGHNGQYYAGKWGNPYAWVDQARQLGFRGGTGGADVALSGTPADLFPTQVLVQDQGGRQYVLHEGRKYPCSGLEEMTGIPPVVLSRLDLRSIPTAEAVRSEQDMLSLLLPAPGGLIDGQIVSGGDGIAYQYCKGAVRPFVSDYALKRWNLKERGIVHIPPEQLRSIPRGLPLIAPPVLENPVL
ncbi:glycosyltransferase family 2 protein [Paenibacillus sp. VCA1]|uniref:glycosyltransferase family 2 protein n=1 Tax=Paenibacillus sp. VCA1 TaxID=3039148 RepID=UPI0028727F7B|nr:glycosyltransferase family 2 protein [Paenibacillus sp. VCA1]MDR9856690.1 glycosyltransferase family 2 protein [Paenibacillus sp. VCA1]